jgi:hypothetical protein
MTRRKSARLRVGQILNPYPAHYRPAFAFSDVLYRQTRWRPLRLAVSNFREVYRLTTFRISTVIGGLGSAFSPGVHHLRQVIL